LVFAALVLAGCATAPPSPSPSAAAVVPDAPFALDGRLSARRERDGVAANFTWIHAPPRDTLTVSTPLGQVIAELQGDASARRVTLTRNDGTTEEASDWTALTERALGFALPVEGLSAWARGGAHDGSAASRETDAAGRTSLLRQDGWEIVYDYDDASREPKRIRLTYPGVELRIVADRWRAP
jgi:outer membrane lipoprotein LolB